MVPKLNEHFIEKRRETRRQCVLRKKQYLNVEKNNVWSWTRRIFKEHEKKYKHSFRVNKRDTQFNLCISKIHVKIIEIIWFREAVMRNKDPKLQRNGMKCAMLLRLAIK